MKVVYASRTGNVEALIGKLGITDALHIEDGTEKNLKTISYLLIQMALEMFLMKYQTS